MNKKALFLMVILGSLGSFLWAAQPQAVLQSLKGKVEVKAPGGKTWAPAAEGQVLSLAATLSTGFDSSVVVVIDKTTIQVKPLTRLTIDKLVAEGDTVKTATFLRVGSVSASVKSSEGIKQDFKVQSPYSTASVRGTEFDFDGISLKVKEGLVAFVLGRAQRELQDPVLGSADDFTGSPDVQASETTAIPVPAGKDVKVVVDFNSDSTPKSTTSSDKDSLEQGSGRPTVQNDDTPKSAPPTKGRVKMSIEFVN